MYALLWWVMFVVGEIGQAIGPNYTWKEAIAGMVSETIYVPLAAYVTNWFLGWNRGSLAAWRAISDEPTPPQPSLRGVHASKGTNEERKEQI